MKKSYKLAFLSVLTLMGTMQGANLSWAQAPIAKIPQFQPSTGWNVQPSTMGSIQGVALPCMMGASYDNGYTVRFSGSQGKILAMAIDFRQNVFTQGRKYPTNLNVENSFERDLTGTAFTQSVLIFNMREISGFYNAALSASNMTLNVEGNSMAFALGDIRSALGQLASCSTTKPAVNKPSVRQTAFSPPKVSRPFGLSLDNIMGTPEPEYDAFDIKQIPSISRPVRGASLSAVSTPHAPTLRTSKMINNKRAGQVWEAKAGSDMKVTLQGWARRAGVALDWQATGASKVVDDVRVVGSFQEAVQALMARNSAALGLDANLNLAGGHRNSVGRTSMVNSAPVNDSSYSGYGNYRARVSLPVDGDSQAHQVNFSAPPRTTHNSGLWSASKGANLQQVLRAWSAKEGVELIWQANNNFPIKNAVNAGGAYEEALQALLGQYQNDKRRPRAQLNNDPVTGRRTLFVQSPDVL